jgi:hypothetical protein
MAGKKAGFPSPPPDTHHWMLWRFEMQKTGQLKRVKMTSPAPLPDGQVPDAYPTADFSAKYILDTWGDGKYYVCFWREDGKRRGTGTFELARPTAAPPAAGRLRRSRASMLPTDPAPAPRGAEDLEEPAGRGRAGGEILSFTDYLMMQREDRAAQERREERQQERMRQEAVTAQERDRQFMGQMLATVAALSQQKPASTPDSDLLRREMALTIREGMSQIRREFAPLMPEEEEEADDAPPKDIGEAGERIGMRLLSEIEAKTPELLEEAIPRIVDWLSSKGFRPSPELAARLQEQAAAGAAVNGRGRA